MKIKDITCISDLYYVIGRWFTFAMMVLAFVTMPFALDVYESVYSFLVCSSIAFVGCAADYKEKFDYPVHYISAMISAFSCVIWVSVICPWCLFALIIGAVAFIDKKRWLLWCEVALFITFYICLIYGKSIQ